MKTIKVLIAATEELHDEKIQFTALIAQLNGALRPRGIELERIKWNPETDGSIEDFMAEMHSCEMCLTLYWRELADQSEEELNVAYQSLKDGKNPQNLYVFFKEPTEEVSDALRDFKANFVTNYGHFFCKFENVDTMNLHFILQFEAYQNRLESDGNKLITVSNGKVKVGDKELVDLDNVPFAALNKEYQRLQHELAELDAKLEVAKKIYDADTRNTDSFAKLIKLANEREDISKEYEKHQTYLFTLALRLAERSGERCSDRILRAQEEFEKGNAIEADDILNEEARDRDIDRELQLYDRHVENLVQLIHECVLKTSTVMLNTNYTLSERFDIACRSYEKAIHVAKRIHYDEDKLAEILFDYAVLLHKIKQYPKALVIYNETLSICRNLAKTNNEKYSSYVANTMHNMAIVQELMHNYSDALKNYLSVLEMLRNLSRENPNEYVPEIADCLHNIAHLQYSCKYFAEGERNYKKALDMYRRLFKVYPDLFQPKVALALNNLAILQGDLHHFKDAKKNYDEALRIRYQLADKDNDTYMPEVADTLNNIANLHCFLHHYAEAKKYYLQALNIYQNFAHINAKEHLPAVALILNNLGALFFRTEQYEDAENYIVQALKIRQQLVENCQEAFLQDLAMSYNNLGSVQYERKRYQEAEANYIKALDIRKRLVSPDDTCLPDNAMTLHNLAELQLELQRPVEALKNCMSALNIYRQLVEAYPDAYMEDLADSLSCLARIKRNMKENADALKYATEALRLYELIDKLHIGICKEKIKEVKEFIKELH